jgi:DNA-binding NtrC family response regulator
MLSMERNENECPVLIVDDDGDLCRILAAILRNFCPVHIEHDLGSAECYLKTARPMIVLLDNNLPDGLGISYIRHILDLYPGIKVALMTSDTSSGLMEGAIEEGAVRFIAKPFRSATIINIILSICPELRAA